LRIHHSVSGGLAFFPGLARPRILDTDKLPPDVARDLVESVSRADFFALPPLVGSSRPGAADVPKHTLTVEDNGRAHTVQIVETNHDTALQDLLSKIETQIRATAPV
jgi:hypothetical protein